MAGKTRSCYYLHQWRELKVGDMTSFIRYLLVQERKDKNTKSSNFACDAQRIKIYAGFAWLLSRLSVCFVHCFHGNRKGSDSNFCFPFFFMVVDM